MVYAHFIFLQCMIPCLNYWTSLQDSICSMPRANASVINLWALEVWHAVCKKKSLRLHTAAGNHNGYVRNGYNYVMFCTSQVSVYTINVIVNDMIN